MYAAHLGGPAGRGAEPPRFCRVLCAAFRGGGWLDSCDNGRFVVQCLVLNGCPHPEGAVPAEPVVEALEVLEQGGGQLEARMPAAPVQ